MPTESSDGASRPQPAPEQPFHVREAYAAGLSRKQLRHAGYAVPHEGVRRPREPSPASTSRARVLRAAEDYLPVLRGRLGEAFSHTTALHIYGAPIRGYEELHVSIPAPHAQARRAGVHGHRYDADTDVMLQRMRVRGPVELPTIGPVSALIQAASSLSFREQVVAADHLVKFTGRPGSRRALTRLDSLIAAARASRARGILRLRAALRVARVGAESRMETLQHFELARLGLDDLELQADIYDAHGRWIGRFDAVDHERKLILEYDGEQHRLERTQYLRDERRLERVREAGYRVMRTHFEDFQTHALRRTRERLCEFLERRPRPLAPDLAHYFAESERG